MGRHSDKTPHKASQTKKPNPPTDASSNSVPCWCGRVCDVTTEKTEIQCDSCASWSHFECSGLSLRSLCTAVNSSGAIYLCRSCVDLPNIDEIRSKSGSSLIYEFNAKIDALHKCDDEYLTSYGATAPVMQCLGELKTGQSYILQKVESCCKAVPAFIAPTVEKLYADMAKKNVVAGPPSAKSMSAYESDKLSPELSIVVEKIADPLQYRDTLNLKTKFDDLDQTISPNISRAKIIRSGHLFLEVISSTELEPTMQKLSVVREEVFGPDSKIRKMNESGTTPQHKSVLVRGIPRHYSMETIESALKHEYPSVEEIIDLSKPGSTSRYKSIKVVLSETAEGSNLIGDGFRVGFCIFRGQEWIRPPMRCYNCQNYGHAARACRAAHRCVTCSETHAPDKSCSKTPKCANCGGAHSANDRSCPKLKAAMDSRAHNINS